MENLNIKIFENQFITKNTRSFQYFGIEYNHTAVYGRVFIKKVQHSKESSVGMVYVGDSFFSLITLNTEGVFLNAEKISEYCDVTRKSATIKRNMRKALIKYLNQDKLVSVKFANRQLRKLIPDLKYYKHELTRRWNVWDSMELMSLKHRVRILMRIAHGTYC